MRKYVWMIWLCCCAFVQAQVFPDSAIRDCQWVDTSARTVTLIFAPDRIEMPFPADSIKKVYVCGSISEYGDRMPGYRLDNVNEQGCYYHTFSYEEVSRPGNSGQPEFMFLVDLADDSTSYYILPDTIGDYAIDRRRIFINNETWILITYPHGAEYLTTDLDELYARSLEARYVRPVADYDLTDSIDQHRICNFRLTPGTKNLYRSYHPYYPDKPQYDTEQERLYWVAELARRVGIRSDITLSSNKESAVGEKIESCGDTIVVTIPDYHQAIIDSGHIWYVGGATGRKPSAGQCFYHSDGPYFAEWMQEVVLFIADTLTPMPVQIHCALGADRTGMVCATIAALCGADWQTIMADYQETGNMKIQTYRHPNRLRYAMQMLTGLNPDQCTTAQLAAAIRAHFVEMGVLTDEQIDRMVDRLCTPPCPTALPNESVCSEKGPTYDVLGRKNPQRGIVITKGSKQYIVNE